MYTKSNTYFVQIVTQTSQVPYHHRYRGQSFVKGVSYGVGSARPALPPEESAAYLVLHQYSPARFAENASYHAQRSRAAVRRLNGCAWLQFIFADAPNSSSIRYNCRAATRLMTACSLFCVRSACLSCVVLTLAPLQSLAAPHTLFCWQPQASLPNRPVRLFYLLRLRNPQGSTS